MGLTVALPAVFRLGVRTLLAKCVGLLTGKKNIKKPSTFDSTRRKTLHQRQQKKGKIINKRADRSIDKVSISLINNVYVCIPTDNVYFKEYIASRISR